MPKNTPQNNRGRLLAEDGQAQKPSTVRDSLSLRQRQVVERLSGQSLGVKEELMHILRHIEQGKGGDIAKGISLLPITSSKHIANDSKKPAAKKHKSKDQHNDLAKADRKAVEAFMQKPSRIFASIEAMSQTWRIISSKPMPDLVKTLDRQAFGMFSENAAFLYLTAIRDCFMGSSKSQQRLEAKNALLLMNAFVTAQAETNTEHCKLYYHHLLNAITKATRQSVLCGPDQTGAAAYFLWTEHNRNFGSPDPTPPNRVSPSLAMLYRTAGQGDEEALDLLRRIHMLIRASVLGLKVASEFRVPVAEATSEGLVLYWSGTDGYDQFVEWAASSGSSYEVSTRTMETLFWVDTHRELVQKRLEDMWEDIKKHPKRTLSPDGDMIYVEGLAKECGSPVRILTNEVPDEGRVETVVEDTSIAPNGKPTYHGSGMERSFIPTLMQGDAIGIVCYMGDLVGYHKIICGERGRSESSDTVTRKTYNGAEVITKIVGVKGHRTPLYGRTRSSDALTNFKAARGSEAILEDGYTWVKEHKREQRIDVRVGQRLHRRIGRQDIEPQVIVDMPTIIKDLAKRFS